MEIKLDRPYPGQELFLTADTRYVAYGGARGGGKSWAARAKAVLLALRWPGIQILLLRRTLRELRENHVVFLCRQLKGVARYRESTREFLFPNGARLVLGYCDAERDVLQYQGQAYDAIFMEEATHFTEFQYLALTESNRASGMCAGQAPGGEPLSHAGDICAAGRGPEPCRGPGGDEGKHSAASGTGGGMDAGGMYTGRGPEPCRGPGGDEGKHGAASGTGGGMDAGGMYTGRGPEPCRGPGGDEGKHDAASGAGGVGPEKFSPRMYLTCNPGGVGHGWVKRLFIDRQYTGGERADDYTMIRARVYDNVFLMENDPDYVRTLENLPGDRRRAMLDGDWDVFSGQYFSEFRRETHVLPVAYGVEIGLFDGGGAKAGSVGALGVYTADTPPAVLTPRKQSARLAEGCPESISHRAPARWRRYVALDYGLDMLACYWIALDERGRAYVYRELYESGLVVSDAAARILELGQCDSGDADVCAYIAPPDLWNRHADSGRSTAELFAEQGIGLVRARNERVQGWYELKEWLKPVLDEQGRIAPRLRIFENCVNLIRTLPALQFDARNPNDVAREPHELTHGPDALRYFCAGRPLPAEGAGWRRGAGDAGFDAGVEAVLRYGQR